MARCVIDAPQKAFVGHTFVRMWWPGRSYWVSTLQYGSGAFATHIYICNATGVQSIYAPPLYEEHYSDLSHARVGHEKVVALLANGLLKLRRRGFPGRDVTGAPAYCPNCYAEYRVGFDQCSDCQIPLVKREW